MYPVVGYCKKVYAALVTRRVKRSLTICFCMFVLMLAGSSLQRGTAGAGDWTPAMNQSAWSNTIALTIFDGYLYTIHKSGTLYRTDLSNEKFIQLGKPDFATTEFLFADKKSLYTIETGGSLYRVSPSDGAWSQVGEAGAWKDTITLVTLNNSLYSIEKSGGLYRTDLTSGQWVLLGKPDFANTKFMFTDGKNLYTIEADGNLYRVNPKDGTWSGVGGAGEWKDTIKGATLNGRIYTVELSGGFYETDPATGAWKQIGPTDYGKNGKLEFMFGANGSLWAIEDGHLYRLNLQNPGSFRQMKTPL